MTVTSPSSATGHRPTLFVHEPKIPKMAPPSISPTPTKMPWSPTIPLGSSKFCVREREVPYTTLQKLEPNSIEN